MIEKYPPITSKLPVFLHGGDYNPDQWPAEVWEEDMRLMKLAHCNAMSVGIFAWARLEPAEGQFDFDWLDRVMDMIAANGGVVVLATPSGARPAWLARKYPEVLRVREDRQRNLFGGRHNHCLTSPIYREKVRLINSKLAERYAHHPALAVWHLSNEYSGDCHCELCRAAFIEWLKAKYGTLDALNHAWWTAFWSHTYTDWDLIEPPSRIGETSVHGLALDWKRFVTDQTTDFMRHEIAALREFTPDVPVTTNMMGTFTGLNYWRMAPHLDVISWDSYPTWHAGDDVKLAADVAFVHDINRCLKGGKPFMLMESVPSATNWVQSAKVKRPGMHVLSSLQAVAHGADTVQYFQWRKSRGSAEKFHGAVVDHVGHEHTRVFRDVADLGVKLEQLAPVVGTTVRPDVAIIYDWENLWAMNDAQGPRRGDKGYLDACKRHYRAFWERGIPVDVIDMEQDLSRYKLVIAPMLYMLRPGVDERIAAFVDAGGTFVATYWTGIVDENDLVILGGWPGGKLRQVLGIWDEEIDALYENDRNAAAFVDGNPLGLVGEYELRDYCTLVHPEGAQVLATYRDDFYAGRPVLTANAYGDGQAYYLASNPDDGFLRDFYGALDAHLGLLHSLDADLPHGVSAQLRTDGETEYVFVMNFNAEPVMIDLGETAYTDLLTGETLHGAVEWGVYEVKVLVA
ncbi:MAG TPA: beta-galactosidase [Anaerolineae bacterium]|nr:beta-galactosidase [Anaerolineae bacterium]HQH39048.1 beta-galactosidase [Anaerolineae bacterium]